MGIWEVSAEGEFFSLPAHLATGQLTIEKIPLSGFLQGQYHHNFNLAQNHVN
jgi:hypothetical protein